MNRDILLFSHVANRDVFFLRLERPLIAFFEIPLRGHTKFQYFQLHISIQFCLNLVISCAGCVRCLLLQNENTKTPIIELFFVRASYEPREKYLRSEEPSHVQPQTKKISNILPTAIYSNTHNYTDTDQRPRRDSSTTNSSQSLPP